VRFGKSSPAAPANLEPAAPAASEAAASVVVISPQERELRTKLRELREHLVRNAENVEQRFPEEARKMHYGEKEHRSIYGTASPDDAKALHEEGIMLADPTRALDRDRRR